MIPWSGGPKVDPSRPSAGRLKEGEAVAVRVLERRQDAEGRLHGGGPAELDAARLERLDLAAAVARGERHLVALLPARVEEVLALDQGELHLRAGRRHGEPARAPLLPVVLALLEAELAHVEVEGLVLVAHEEGDVGGLLDHDITSSWRRP